MARGACAVLIKGTQIYDPKRGGYVELSMLDVMQVRLDLPSLADLLVYGRMVMGCNEP